MVYYNEDYMGPSDYGYYHESELPNFELVEELLKDALNAIYESGDVVELANSLDHLAECFDIKYPEKEPKLFNSFVDLTKHYAKKWRN